MKANKIKHLDDYQLYQLLHNDAIDELTLKLLEKEFKTRNIASNTKEELELRYQQELQILSLGHQEKPWNPLYTGFALNRHFRHIAFLKSQGRKKEAKNYTIRLYFGIGLYYVLILIILLLWTAF